MKSGKNYPLLLAGQFLGAFGDNFLLAGILAPLTFLKNAGAITEQQVNGTNTTFSIVFFIPFILLAPLAGVLPDKPRVGFAVGFTGHGLSLGAGTALRGVERLLKGTPAGAVDAARLS